jgi:hypothetical protein
MIVELAVTSFVRTAACRQPRQSNPLPPGFLCRWCLDRLPLGACPSRVATVAEHHHHITQDRHVKTSPLHEPSPPRSLHTAGVVCFHPARCQPHCHLRQARAPDATPLCVPMCRACPIAPFYPTTCARARELVPSTAAPDTMYSRLLPVKHKQQEHDAACPSCAAGTASAHHATLALQPCCVHACAHPVFALACTALLCCAKRHVDAKPSRPWHRERRYKRAPPTSCPHRTPPAVFL